MRNFRAGFTCRPHSISLLYIFSSLNFLAFLSLNASYSHEEVKISLCKFFVPGNILCVSKLHSEMLYLHLSNIFNTGLLEFCNCLAGILHFSYYLFLIRYFIMFYAVCGFMICPSLGFVWSSALSDSVLCLVQCFV